MIMAKMMVFGNLLGLYVRIGCLRLNCYYYRHYSFVKDIQMIFCTVLGKNMKYAGEVI